MVLDSTIIAGTRRVFLSATDRNSLCNAHIYTCIRVSVQSNYNHVKTTVSFCSSLSFDSRLFYIKTTLSLHCLLTSFSSQSFCTPILEKIIQICFLYLHLHLLSGSVCSLHPFFSCVAFLFIPPLASSPPFHPLNRNISQPTNKSSVIHLASLFPPFSFLHAPPHLPGSSLAISAQRFPSFSCAW